MQNQNYGGGEKDAISFKSPLPFSEDAVYRLYLEIPWCPESLNRKLRSNRYKNAAEMKAWANFIVNDTYSRRPAIPLARVSLTFTRYSHRFLDYDGLVASLKPVADALVAAKILVDDSWNVTGAWSVDQVFRPQSKGQMLAIGVEEVLT